MIAAPTGRLLGAQTRALAGFEAAPADSGVPPPSVRRRMETLARRRAQGRAAAVPARGDLRPRLTSPAPDIPRA